MKIKLPFTEKFLWDIFELIKIKDEIMDSIWSKQYHGLKHPFAMAWPSYFEYRDSYWERYKDKKKRERFSQLVFQLKQRGYLKVLKVKDRSAIILTPKAFDKLFKIKLKLVEKKRRKDKKWQMVLFDIPENKKRERDLFRKALQYLGYKRLQKSIWVCPFDVLKETEELIKRYRLKEYIELLLVQKIGFG